MGTDSAIFRTLGQKTAMRTDQYNSRWLNGKLPAHLTSIQLYPPKGCEVVVKSHLVSQPAQEGGALEDSGMLMLTQSSLSNEP